MPDLTLCCNWECKLGDDCWRRKAPPQDERQTYALFHPSETYDAQTGEVALTCRYYMSDAEAKW